MPFIGALPERRHVFQPEPHNDIAVSDTEAWRLYGKHRHVYNKLELARSQNLLAHPCTVRPTAVGISPDTRLFVKPSINLHGMSIDARIEHAGEVQHDEHCFWSEVFEGQQSSTDCLLLDGKVKWLGHTLASKEKNQHRPVYWELGADLSHSKNEMTEFIETRLPGYTGICNIERIGNRVIEMHLRGSNGFFDLYPQSFVASWVSLVDKHHWTGIEPLQHAWVYSVFGPGHIALDTLKRIADELGVSIRADSQTADRIAIIQSTSLKKARQASEHILRQATN